MNLEQIKAIKTVEQCENLARNAKQKGRDDLVEAALRRAEEIRIEQAVGAGRRPDINYLYLGLRIGDKLVLPEIEVEAEVFSDRMLAYKGSAIHISPLEDELIAAGHPRRAVANKWVVKDTGESLSDLYERIYGPRLKPAE